MPYQHPIHIYQYGVPFLLELCIIVISFSPSPEQKKEAFWGSKGFSWFAENRIYTQALSGFLPLPLYGISLFLWCSQDIGHILRDLGCPNHSYNSSRKERKKAWHKKQIFFLRYIDMVGGFACCIFFSSVLDFNPFFFSSRLIRLMVALHRCSPSQV